MSIMLQPQRAGAPPRASRAAWPRQRRAGALSGARRSRALASAAREAPPLPQSCQAAISAAAAASAEALAAGRVRQTVELLLPVNQRSGPGQYCNTEALDYPCSASEEFGVALECAAAFLDALADARGRGREPAAVERVGDGGLDGDNAAVVVPSQSKDVAVIAYPNANVLPLLKKLDAKDSARPLILMCPQWTTTGNLLSDFGVGPWRAANEAFVARFAPVYQNAEVRVGSILPGESGLDGVAGAVFRLLCVGPEGRWAAYVMTGQEARLVADFDERPTYVELEKLIEEGKARTSVFNSPEGRAEASKRQAAQAGSDGPGLGAAVVTLAELDVTTLDKKELRSYLGALGKPAAGKLDVLRARLEEAITEKLAEDNMES